MCSQDSSYYSQPGTHINQVKMFLVPLANANIITTAFYMNADPAPIGYLSSDLECVDCTIRGVTKPPAFWK
jgi:hypothetical protein